VDKRIICGFCAAFFVLKYKNIMLQKSKKEEMIKDLEGAIKNSESLVFVNFHGLKVSDETKLRSELREQGVSYRVSRKTLLARALKGKAEGEIPELAGEVAIAYSKDAISSPREVYNFQKTHKGMLNILGGIFEGKFVSSAYMMELATIPSREVLLSKIAFLLKSPMQRLAIAVGEVAKKK
jgi:large subunit ribosomal protein L10